MISVKKLDKRSKPIYPHLKYKINVTTEGEFWRVFYYCVEIFGATLPKQMWCRGIREIEGTNVFLASQNLSHKLYNQRWSFGYNYRNSPKIYVKDDQDASKILTKFLWYSDK